MPYSVEQRKAAAQRNFNEMKRIHEQFRKLQEVLRATK